MGGGGGLGGASDVVGRTEARPGHGAPGWANGTTGGLRWAPGWPDRRTCRGLSVCREPTGREPPGAGPEWPRCWQWW